MIGALNALERLDNIVNSLDFDKNPEETRVVVAMSGGVDSSVVAGLLKRQGYEVIGITLQLYDHGAAVHRAGSCCAGQDIEDARRVSDMLDIPYYVLDYEKKFREAVINPFAESYVAGETPIPCVTCNQTVKFADLLQTAKELGADCLATGHYIRSYAGQKGEGRCLQRPVDDERDQSYFLFATTQAQIDYLRFPLGGLSKAETRILADEMGLEIAQKPDSQDICFVPQGKYSDIVAKIKPNAFLAGDIIHIDGRVLGSHQGVHRYTIGQRRGIGVSAGEPLYVVQLDARTKRVIVGGKSSLSTQTVYLRDVNWLGDGELDNLPKEGMPIFAKLRSTRPPEPARLYNLDGEVFVELEKGEDGIATGQACVFYSDQTNESRVLGGGFICKTKRDERTEKMLARIFETNENASQKMDTGAL